MNTEKILILKQAFFSIKNKEIQKLPAEQATS